MASRSCTLLSPRVIRPLRSRTVTPSTSREAIVSATEIPPFSSRYGYSTFEGQQRKGICSCPTERRPPCLGCLGRRQMFYQRQFGSGMQLSKVYLIHERADDEDAAAGAAQQVFRRQRIGKRLRIESFALVGNDKYQVLAVVFERGGDLLARVVFISVEHGVYGSFTHRHSDVEARVFVQAGLLGNFVRDGLNLVDALHGRLESNGLLAFFRFAQLVVNPPLPARRPGSEPHFAPQPPWTKFHG